MSRTVVRIGPHIASIIAHLDDSVSFPVVGWTRPEDANAVYVDPPYAAIRPYPSAEEFGGPLSDSQADINLRVQVLGVGETEAQAMAVTDKLREYMQKEDLRDSIPNRKVIRVGHMVVFSGVTRENDLPNEWFYSVDLYEIMTVPA